MSGGTFVTMNKVRAGAYINVVANPRPVGGLSDRGAVAICLSTVWGDDEKLITLYASDLLDGTSKKKIGCTISDPEALPYRLALENCPKALIYPANYSRAKATLEGQSVDGVATYTISAKHGGSAGNKISVAVETIVPSRADAAVNIVVYFGGLKQETFPVSIFKDATDIESDWIAITFEADKGESKFKAMVATALSGGTNGQESAVLPEFFAAIENEKFDCVAYLVNETGGETAATSSPIIEAQIKRWRESEGRKVQAVVYNATSDYEGIIKTTQGFVNLLNPGTRNEVREIISPELFVIWVAGLTAGSQMNQSNTSRVLTNAAEIINPVTTADIETKLKTGYFLLSYRQDKAVIIEKDINSLHTFTPEKSYDFSKNRVLRVLDGLANDTALLFMKNYSGKANNNTSGRNSFKAELINMGKSMQGINAIQDFDGPADITIMQGADLDSVVVDWQIKPVDSMEKLYMTVYVNV